MGSHPDNIPFYAEHQPSQELVNDLRSVYRVQANIPGRVDEAVMAQARLALARQRRSRLILRWCMPAAAAAAIVLLVVVGPWLRHDARDVPVVAHDTSQNEATPYRESDAKDSLLAMTPVREGADPDTSRTSTGGQAASGTPATSLGSADTAVARAHGRADLAMPLTQDIDCSGRVDILDALALACQIKADAFVDLSWDFNGDGAIDRLDVDTLAMSAVRLDQENVQ